MTPHLTNEHHAVHSVDARERIWLRLPSVDSLRRRPVGRHEVPTWVYKAVGYLLVVGVLDAIVVVLMVVAEVLLAWCLMDII